MNDSLRVVDVHENLRSEIPGLTLPSAPDKVLGADRLDGRIQYDADNAEIIQLVPAPDDGRPPFWLYSALARAQRPQNLQRGVSPISIEAVRLSGQHFFVVELIRWLWLILANPFAYAPRSLTWAAADPLEQAVVDSGDMGLWRMILEVMLFVCQSIGGDIVGFNARVGNSLNQLHFVSHRLPDGIGPYALQQVAAKLDSGAKRSVAHIGRDHNYPIDAWRFGFPYVDTNIEAAVELLARWLRMSPNHSANVAAVMEDGVPVLYVVPRNRLLRPWGWLDMPAVVEVLGGWVASREEVVARVRTGDWDYNHFWCALASVRPLGVGRLL
jgi:hypothetical protein